MQASRFGYTLVRLVAICTATPLAPVVHAQEPRSTEAPSEADRTNTIAEVIVTARRRTESAQDVPISIVTRTGEYLEAAQVDSFTELDRVVPGFIFKEYESGGASTMGIRGLSTFSQSGAQQSVGLVVDGVVLGRIGQAVTNFDDVERVEVLRGPQGTLFGKNTTGGVVQIVTKDPTDEFDAKTSVSYGSYNEMKWNGTVNVPITGSLSNRTSAFAFSRDGYIENINNGQMLGDDSQVGLRTKFLFEPREGTRLMLTGHYAERSQVGASSGGGQPVLALGPSATETAVITNQAIAGPENDKVNGVGFHPYKDNMAGASLTWDQDIGDFALTSITAWEYWNWDFGQPAPFRTFNAPTPVLFWERFFFATKVNDWSQELRLASPTEGRLQYVVGGFVSESNNTGPSDLLANNNAAFDADPSAPPVYLFANELIKTRNFNYAGFAEADLKLTDTVTLTAGTRWTHDEMRQKTNAQAVPGFVPAFGIGFGPNGELYIPILGSASPGVRSLEVSENMWSWRGGLRWEPTPDLMLYGTVARGTKGPAISAVSVPLAPVGAEYATNYELGVKADFLDNRLRTSLTAFDTDVKDLQAESQVILETPNGFVSQINLTNAGKVRTRGVEFEISAVPTTHLSFDLSLAYIDAIYKKFLQASCYQGQTTQEGCFPNPVSGLNFQNLSGKRLPFVPELSGSLGVNYDFKVPLWAAENFVRLDYTYQSEINWSLGLAPLNKSDPIGVVGLSLGMRSPDSRYEVVLAIKNLTDEFVVNGLNGGNAAITADLQPDYQRTWLVKVSYKR